VNTQEIADRLNGIEYGSEGTILTREFCKELKKEGIVVVFGHSDDLVEFAGVINDEFGPYGHYLNSKGFILNDCEDELCPYFEKIMSTAKYYIKPEWCKTNEYAWTYDTNIPHKTFDVIEHVAGYEEKYCRGLVFKLSDME
jgi:hypothetical protein